MGKVTRIALAATALVVLLPGCDRAGRADDGQMELTDTAAVEQQIRDIEKQWMAEYNSRNVDALAAHLVDVVARVDDRDFPADLLRGPGEWL